ncbi:hypothetical protein [Lysinibacillus sp. FSL W8-0992]|uniref:hypothetical protein n=1 Tax=Lysinibacillus sp. FSL W8-0992 TaxID=2954643 RepID=UPI0030F72905
MSDVKLSSFHSNKTAALTMLYLGKQDLSILTKKSLMELHREWKENKKGKRSLSK